MPVEAVVVRPGRPAAVVLQVAAGVPEPLSVPRVAQHGPRLHRAPGQGSGAHRRHTLPVGYTCTCVPSFLDEPNTD